MVSVTIFCRSGDTAVFNIVTPLWICAVSSLNQTNRLISAAPFDSHEPSHGHAWVSSLLRHRPRANLLKHRFINPQKLVHVLIELRLILFP